MPGWAADPLLLKRYNWRHAALMHGQMRLVSTRASLSFCAEMPKSSYWPPSAEINRRALLWIIFAHSYHQGRIKTALGPGAMTYCRAPMTTTIYIYIYIYIYSFNFIALNIFFYSISKFLMNWNLIICYQFQYHKIITKIRIQQNKIIRNRPTWNT